MDVDGEKVAFGETTDAEEPVRREAEQKDSNSLATFRDVEEILA